MSHHTARWGRVASVEYERTDEYFDLHVPGEEHYLAEGVWHHNTGKSVVILAKCLTLLDKYPGTRGLFARKWRAALTESGLVSWERDVLGLDNPVLTRSPILRRVRQAYDLPNGSSFVVCGLDKPGKALSSDYDFVYTQEATDFTVDDWETLSGRLRTGVASFQQMMADCNPTTPTHWLYKRQAAGKLRMYTSRHRDNPRWADRAGNWTPAGLAYLARLGRMTGARRKRFLDGVWASAEGLVYDGYDPERHLLPDGWRPPADWPRLWSIDWGYTPSPIVLQFWAIDAAGRLHLYRETYRTRQTVADLAAWSRGEIEAGREPYPTAVVSDHEPEKAAVFSRTAGVHVVPAEKFDKLAGIQQVQARLDISPDGKPRIFVSPTARRHDPDDELGQSGKPTSTIEELAGYVWDTRNPDRPKDVPLDLNDHGCDAMLYAVRWADRNDPHDGDPYGGDHAAVHLEIPK